MRSFPILAKASLILCLGAAAFTVSAEALTVLQKQGERIYRTGELGTGVLLEARVQGDVQVSARQLICVQCHRRSGFGSSESETIIPPITARALLSPKLISRRELYAARTDGAGTRPAYTPESLARAIRDGIDPAGRVLNPSMPRFDLPPDEMKALITYLMSLSAENDPGVTASELHLATIIGPEVSAQRRHAMLSLMNAYIASKNGNTRNETKRAIHTPWQKESSYPAYRRWVLHTWQLTGAPADWPQQLQRFYQQQPVFAVLGGIIDEEFQPIADFCNTNTLPCLFPTSDLPAQDPGFYTLHFHEGRRLEARALATHLQGQSELMAGAEVRQVYHRQDATGARALRISLPQTFTLEDIPIDGDAGPGLWRQLRGTRILIAWLSPEEISTLAPTPPYWPERLYLQSTLDQESLRQLPAALRERIYLLYPYALPEFATTHQQRVNTWLRFKGIKFDAPREQSDSYFILTLFNDVMHHIDLNFSRDYAIETIEHMVDYALFNSVYPQVSLAPGQRFVSKGCYVVHLSTPTPSGLNAASRWIIP